MSKRQHEIQGPLIECPRLFIGLDPGKSQTGFAECHTDPVLNVVKAGRLDNEAVWERLRHTDPGDLIICEGFRLYKWAAQDLVGSDFREVRNIGRIEEITEWTGATLWMIPASSHKQAISREFLVDTGAWSRNDHIADALTAMWYGILRWRTK